MYLIMIVVIVGLKVLKGEIWKDFNWIRVREEMFLVF